MTYKTLAKICAAISVSSIVYMFLITYEGTYFGWTVFFVFMAFATLFHALDEKEEEIVMLRSLKEVKQAKEEEREIDPRRGDPFYISDKFNPNYQKLMEEKNLKETNSPQSQNTKESSKEKEVEITFIPTWHPGMEKQWGKPFKQVPSQPEALNQELKDRRVLGKPKQ